MVVDCGFAVFRYFMRNCLQKAKNVIQLFLKNEQGQAIAEYSVLVVMFLGVTLMLVTLLRIFSSYGWRILNLIGMDYP
jgi:Flp pilus assembly pilin Flp